MKIDYVTYHGYRTNKSLVDVGYWTKTEAIFAKNPLQCMGALEIKKIIINL